METIRSTNGNPDSLIEYRQDTIAGKKIAETNQSKRIENYCSRFVKRFEEHKLDKDQLTKLFNKTLLAMCAEELEHIVVYNRLHYPDTQSYECRLLYNDYAECQGRIWSCCSSELADIVHKFFRRLEELGVDNPIQYCTIYLICTCTYNYARQLSKDGWHTYGVF